MNGRTIFRKFGRLLNAFAIGMLIFPKGLRLWLLNAIRGIDGNLGSFLRYILVKKLAKSCGDNVVIKPYVVFLQIENLTIGNNVSIHHFCYIDAEGGISIGDDVSIAHNSTILSSNHTWNDNTIPIKYNCVDYKSVVIENDVWIGCGCRILAGTHVCSRSVIAAGAVVTKDVDSNTVVGGVPAKFIKNI